jgi:hypothetical protein
MKVEADDQGKIAYMTAAVADGTAGFGEQRDLDPDLEAAIAWAAGKTPAQIMAAREDTGKAVAQYATERGYALSLWCAFVCLVRFSGSIGLAFRVQARRDG